VNADVAQARQALTRALQSALALAKEHAAIAAALTVEEVGAWDHVSEALLPRFDSQSLHDAAAAVGEPRLPELLRARDAAVADAEARRHELIDAVLPPGELREMGVRRNQVDKRMADLRHRLHELRNKPGMLQTLEAARRGQRLKDEPARAVALHAELQAAIAGLDAEVARLGAITARHNRAKRDLANTEDEVAAVTDRFLGDARRLVADAARRTNALDHPRMRAVGATMRAAGAKRSILALLYEHWLKPHGERLLALEQRPTNLSGFDTVTFPAQVDLAVREAGVALDAFRALLAAARNAHADTTDWWQALVPGVPRPADDSFLALGLSPPPAVEQRPTVAPSNADIAIDRLSAAWAAVRSDAESGGAEGAFLGEMTASETELLALPKAPSPAVGGQQANHISQHTGAGVALTSQEYQAIFDDVHVGGDVFTVAKPDDDPFARPGSTGAFPRTEPWSSRPRVDVGAIVRASFAPGSRIGRCTVLGLVGKGGMGEVYRARLEGELGFTRAVVLKRLSLDHDSDASLMASFVREAEIAARIAHPNVVQIFDLQKHGSEPFMVMEFLEGLPLQKLATRAWRAGMNIESDVITRFALDAARGLFAAHSMRADDGSLAGLVHRDVSPDNLFLCGNGFTKLLDFGIARRSDLTTMTGKNELKGKIPYMSPEQILGEPLDARSDLFSLGSTLYYLLTGERPFVGDNDVTTLYAVVNKAHRPLKERRPDAVGLIDVIEQLMQKSRDDRPASALDVVRRLEGCAPALPEDAGAFLAQVEAL